MTFIDTQGVPKPNSGNLDAGQTYTVSFTKAGTFRYSCAYHSRVIGGERTGMIGTVTVQ